MKAYARTRSVSGTNSEHRMTDRGNGRSESVTKIVPYRNRTLQPGQRVRVYRNLHRKLWSIVDLSSGAVVGHAEEVMLRWAVFKVNDRGRARAVESGVRNVHAWVEGVIVPAEAERGSEAILESDRGIQSHRDRMWKQIRYHPFRGERFHDDGGHVIEAAQYALMGASGRCYVTIIQDAPVVA